MIGTQQFTDMVQEIQEYEKNLKIPKFKEYTISNVELGKLIKIKVNELTFDQLITEVQKIEKIIAAKGYDKKLLRGISSLEERKTSTKKGDFSEIMGKMKQAKKRISEVPLIKPATEKPKIKPKVEKISREDQIKETEEINSMRDYVLISYAREYIRELYDKFNSSGISPEKFRYEVRTQMARDKRISEELIQEKIKKEENPFEELTKKKISFEEIK